MKNQHKYRPYEPKKCWVGDKHKICYADEKEAEMAARLIETEHGLPGYSLHPYHCEYGDHWHLANKKITPKWGIIFSSGLAIRADRS